MRPSELLPKLLIDELTRVARIRRDWVQVATLRGDDPSTFRCRVMMDTWITRLDPHGGSLLSLLGTSIWLIDGPKVFQPSAEQCDAFEQIDVNLPVADYAQPFPSLLVELPKGRYEPFKAVLVSHMPKECVMACTLLSEKSLDDVVTTISAESKTIEDALRKFDPDCNDRFTHTAHLALRVACNACLALANWDHRTEYLFPKEVERDRRLASERSDRGERAAQRVASAVQLVTFSQDVQVHRTRSRNGSTVGELTIATSKKSHWRRGHWAMQFHGPGRSLRKRILRPPTLVRADLFVGDLADTETVYRGAAK